MIKIFKNIGIIYFIIEIWKFNINIFGKEGKLGI